MSFVMEKLKMNISNPSLYHTAQSILYGDQLLHPEFTYYTYLCNIYIPPLHSSLPILFQLFQLLSEMTEDNTNWRKKPTHSLNLCGPPPSDL